LLSHAIKVALGLGCQLGDQFLERQLILGNDLDYLLQAIHALP
jgi:hypothetical protein